MTAADAGSWQSSADEVIRGLPRLHEHFERLLADAVALPAVSATGTGLGAAADQLVAIMAECGLDAAAHKTPGAPIVLGSYVRTPHLPTLLVYGHYDVQPADPSEWVYPPHRLTRVGGRGYGRGTADNKGQHIAQLMAVRGMLDACGELPLNLHILVEGEEEIGSPHLPEWLRENRERLQADFAFTSDGAIHPSGRPVVVCGARGLLYLEVALKVAENDRHSGNYGGVGRNAAAELTSALASLWTADGEVAVEGFLDEVDSVDPALRRAVAGLPLAADQVSAAGARQGVTTAVDWFEAVLLRPTLNLAGIQSGWSGPSMKTIIPARATAKLDARLVPGQKPDQIAARIRSHLQAHNRDITVDVVGSMLPSRSDMESDYVRNVVEAVAHGWGDDPLVYPNLAGSVPDFAFTQILGIPSVIVPYGNADQRNHAADENLELGCMHAGARVLTATMYALGSSAGAERARRTE